MRQILQRPHHVLGQRALTADVQDWTFRAEGGGDAGHGIHAAGSGGGDDTAQLPGLPCIAIGGVGGDLLMPDVDDADALIDAAVVDINDMTAAKRENRVHAFVLQGFGDQVTAGKNAAVAPFCLQGVVRCTR